MAKCWLYIPWEDDGGLAEQAYLMKSWIKDKDIYEQVTVIGPSRLATSQISAHDMLQICGECGPGVEAIGGHNGQSLTAHALAAQFNGRLSQTHRRIDIWACYSADGLSGAGPGARRGLTYRFWQAMHAQGFRKLSVYGYRLAVLDPAHRTNVELFCAQILPGFRTLVETPDLAPVAMGTAENWRAGIDRRGEIIPPTPLKKPNQPVPRMPVNYALPANALELTGYEAPDEVPVDE
jgi:hypothetical protein